MKNLPSNYLQIFKSKNVDFLLHRQLLNEAVRNRALRRSLTEYSQFDWNKIPTGAEKRLMEAENAVTQPDVISIFFQ
jgi:hypothetical protein